MSADTPGVDTPGVATLGGTTSDGTTSDGTTSGGTTSGVATLDASTPGGAAPSSASPAVSDVWAAESLAAPDRGPGVATPCKLATMLTGVDGRPWGVRAAGGEGVVGKTLPYAGNEPPAAAAGRLTLEPALLMGFDAARAGSVPDDVAPVEAAAGAGAAPANVVAKFVLPSPACPELAGD